MADAGGRIVALLRGVNVGGHRVKMAELRGHFEAMGFEDVDSHIASGNLIFSAPETDHVALEQTIEAHLEKALGWEAPTFIRSFGELREAIDYVPPGRTDEDAVYISFLKEPASDELRAALLELNSETDRFHARGRELYWLVHGKLSDSPLFKGSELDRILVDTPHTRRKITSVRKLVERYGP